MSLKTMGQSEENRWRSAVSAGRVLFSIQKTTCRLSENSGKNGVKVWDMVSLSQQNHNGGRRHGVHSRSGSESGNSTAGYPR